MLQILFEKQRKMWQTGIDKGGKMLQIYGKHIKLYFISQIRNEKKFNSLEEFKEQLIKDK